MKQDLSSVKISREGISAYHLQRAVSTLREGERRSRKQRSNTHCEFRVELGRRKLGESPIPAEKYNTNQSIPIPATPEKTRNPHIVGLGCKEETPFCNKHTAQVPPVRHFLLSAISCLLSFPRFPAVMWTFCRRSLKIEQTNSSKTAQNVNQTVNQKNAILAILSLRVKS